MSGKRRAFTLIELLVVVAIIALLISMLLPSLEQARGTARLVACGVNARTIGAALGQYASDNRDYLPLLKDRPYAVSGGKWWFQTLGEWKYMPEGRGDKSLDPKVSGYYVGPWRCPQTRDEELYSSNGAWGGGYGQSSGWIFEYPEAPNLVKKLGSARLIDLPRPGQIWLIGDTGKPDASGTGYVTWPGMFPRPPFNRLVGGPNTQQPACRHISDMASVAFADFHVESRTFDELDTNKDNIFAKDVTGDGMGD